MPPRALWSGSLGFGLVNIPVSVVPAVKDLDLHFRLLHRTDGAPIEVQRWCSKEDVEVPYEQITHGYELDDGRRVIVSDLELAAIEPRKTRTIEIEEFIDLAEVDPIYFDHPYFLVPASEDEGPARAYALLREVMSRTDRAGLGRFVMRAKEYLAIVREGGGALTLSTMRFADEVRDPTEVDVARYGSYQPTRQQLDRAVAVIEELSGEWEPRMYRDEYRERLRRVVERKRRGETIKVPEQTEAPARTRDLMAALERTLEELKRGGGGRQPRTRARQR